MGHSQGEAIEQLQGERACIKELEFTKLSFRNFVKSFSTINLTSLVLENEIGRNIFKMTIFSYFRAYLQRDLSFLITFFIVKTCVKVSWRRVVGGNHLGSSLLLVVESNEVTMVFLCTMEPFQYCLHLQIFGAGTILNGICIN